MRQHTQPSPSGSPTASARGVHHPIVLVIDPAETTRSVLEVSLFRDGFEVMSANSSPQALELVRRRTPDVVVVASDLGTEDGFSLVAELRGDGRLGRVPVLLLARPEDREIEALAEVVGIDACLHKPAYARDVVALVRLEYMRRSGAEEVIFDSAQLPAAHLLRALLATPRSGRLTLAEGHATVAFSQGRVVDVGFDNPHGDIDALVRALALTTSRYSLHLGTVDGVPALRCGLRELVTLVMPRLVKFSEVQTRSVPLEARMVVNFRRLGATLHSLPDGVNGVLQLFDGYRSLLEVLVDSPVNETLTLELSTRLFLMGVLTTALPVPENPGKSPRLFEPQPDEAKQMLREVFEKDAELPSPQANRDTSGDWFEEPHGTGLEVTEPSGGWLAGTGHEVLKDLPPEVQQQLSAFNIELEAEAPQLSSEAKAMGDFVREGATELPPESIEAAIAQLPRITPPLQLTVVQTEATPPQRVEPQPVLRLNYSIDGVITPVLTPARPVAELEGKKAGSDALESGFFETPAPTEAAEVPVAVAEPRKSRSRLTLWVLLVVGVAVLAIGVEVLVQRAVRHPAQVVEVAPPAIVAPLPPVISAPVEVAPVVADEALPAEVLDITENMVEARRAYETGLYAKATTVLNQTLADAPRSTDAWMLLALVRYDARDAAGAQAAATKLLEIEPNNARVQILLASLAFDEGEREKGKVALRRYLELEPNGQHANEARALLKR